MGVTSDYYIPEALWLVEHGYMVMTFAHGIRSTHMGIVRGDKGEMINEKLLKAVIVNE